MANPTEGKETRRAVALLRKQILLKQSRLSEALGKLRGRVRELEKWRGPR